MSISSNAEAIAQRIKKRAKALNRAIRKGLRNAVIKIDNAQVENLSGGDSPGDYPIPVRSGNLLQGHFFKIKRSTNAALVGNTTSYALAVHEGKGSHSVYGKRPFLEDAVDSVDVQGSIRNEMTKTVFA